MPKQELSFGRPHAGWVWGLFLWVSIFTSEALASPVRDDSHLVPSFAAFRQSFLSALKQGNTNFLISSALNKSAYQAMQKNSGKMPLHERLKLMEKAVRMGCMKPDSKKAELHCPTTKYLWPAGKDPRQFIAVAWNRVNLRQAPRAGAVKLGEVNKGIYPLCKVLRLGHDTPHYKGFVCLKAGPKGQGFVREEFVSSPMEPIVKFVLKGNTWYWTGDIP